MTKSNKISKSERLQYRADKRRRFIKIRKKLIQNGEFITNKKYKQMSSKDKKMVKDKVDSILLSIQGNRIVDPDHFIKELQKMIRNHFLNKGSACRLKHLHLSRQSDNHGGLRSLLCFKCSKCNYVNGIWSVGTEKNTLNINTSCVLGCLFSGIVYAHINTVFSTMHIPFKTESTFKSHLKSVYFVAKEVANESMREAAKEEARLAIEAGNIDKESGLPFITVIVEGAGLKGYTKKSMTHYQE